MDAGNMDQGMCDTNLEKEEVHEKYIVHIDVDCFYAQVEMNRNPELRDVPLGIQQKNIIVTCNYEARKFGITKCMLVSDGLRICPNLALVKGEDLHPYRLASGRIFQLLQTFRCPVEKLGMDENFIDVTSIVAKRYNESERSPLIGYLFGSSDTDCPCGCHAKLNIATQVAQEIRNKLFQELNLTVSAGIAHNKLLAKLVGGQHKPDQQTTVYPECSRLLLSTLDSVQSIPGIGVKTAEALYTLGLRTVRDLQNVEVSILKKTFSADMAVRLKNLSVGIDNGDVKQSGKPASIGLEDSFKTISVQSEVEERLGALLARLVAAVRDDGRVPICLKVTLRKRDARRMSSHRETRQCQISPSLFTVDESGVSVSESSQEKLMIIVMRLFHKLIDLTKPFHLTLVGLAFTKFQERERGRGSIVNYFMNDLSVQSVLSLQNDGDTSAGSSMDYSLGGRSPGGSTNTDVSEGEVEPSPKKLKRVSWVAKRRCLGRHDVPSPSKLRVADLRLNSKDLEKVSELRLSSRERDINASDSSEDTCKSYGVPNGEPFSACPPDVDKSVFAVLPEDVQEELKALWKNKSSATLTVDNQSQANKSKPNTILRYFIQNK